jgi:nodulation protein A
VSGPADVAWSAAWEDDLAPADHDDVGALLARAFGRSAAPFGPGRSWASGRPERRVVARADGPEVGAVVAHVGLLRRFVQIGDAAQLVGDVGLVAVHPDRHGTGLGATLLARCAAELDRLAVPFGLLTCGDHVAGFYARAGWVRVPGPTRMVRADGTVQVYGAATMVLPVRAGVDGWPAGRVERNGLEV